MCSCELQAEADWWGMWVDGVGGRVVVALNVATSLVVRRLSTTSSCAAFTTKLNYRNRKQKGIHEYEVSYSKGEFDGT